MSQIVIKINIVLKIDEEKRVKLYRVIKINQSFLNTMLNTEYKFKRTKDKRWGIYLQDRLLATVGDHEVGQFIWLSLSNNLSHTDNQKAAIAYKKATERKLLVS